MAQIINLLEKAKLAKELFMEKLTYRKVNGKRTCSIFICHLFELIDESYRDWPEVVEPFMRKQFTTGWNNIASHVSANVGDHYNDPMLIRYDVAEIVRIKWLDDLIAAAEQHGDDAQLPNIMSQDEIKELYALLKSAV